RTGQHRHAAGVRHRLDRRHGAAREAAGPRSAVQDAGGVLHRAALGAGLVRGDGRPARGNLDPTGDLDGDPPGRLLPVRRQGQRPAHRDHTAAAGRRRGGHVTAALTVDRITGRPWWARPSLLGIMLVVLVLIIGTTGYMIIEGWPLRDALFMTVTSIT